ncbi:MAG: GNAT family N-acetyltransferase [Bdellovibrionota bacterium]
MLTVRNAKKLALASRRTARVPLAMLKSLRPLFRRPGKFPLHRFHQKVAVYQTSENFVLKTAENPFELRQALQLRHEIFYKELQNKETSDRLDVDELDLICDHLLICDKTSGRVVGTYRLISSTFSDRFYSQGEFHIGEILNLPGTKLELGRACIHKDFRNGAIINLLWKGIIEYVKKTDAKYLFGCASVQTTDLLEASQLQTELRERGLSSSEYNVHPTPEYRSALYAVNGIPGTKTQLPGLIQSYILAGTKFYGEPALDRDFECYDFFMMLKVEEMSRIFRRRYKMDEL